MKDILLGAIRGVSEDQIFDACGTAGGLMLAAALLPQIYHVAKRRRARDVSYAYQFIFVVGIVMFLVYYGYYELWALFVPTCLSLACVSCLIVLKTYFDVLKPKRRRRVVAGLNDQVLRGDDGDLDDGLDRPLLGTTVEGQQDDEFIAYPAPVS